ncbi:hypothetical protein [Eoetvoesiella caeni]|uniref:Uncharacterized protein n=1 Tax=Eoetvoesiella caeni TaxID=645616 RepID=A0A366GYB1_9BURK|nr:hypothetical protein [Eoetvoesiella caeni]MCI2811294.1 hypothetical protein [Eoetvoesiella caeni]NYT57248.1 hypothetical protein [Eoetvoesiella caeni]RBP33621.1 hypothetical protein DFR37_12612 [Eoetvoesiella caeni]
MKQESRVERISAAIMQAANKKSKFDLEVEKMSKKYSEQSQINSKSGSSGVSAACVAAAIDMGIV